jgi:L-threonylcarbamoyladenylate synthase
MVTTTTFRYKMIEEHHIVKAAEYLAEDKLVAFPTETVYGLGGNAFSDDVVAAIYETKGRPTFNPLIVHVSSQAEAEKYVAFNDTAKKLAAAFWPGPMTLVLPRRADCKLSLLVSAGLDTVAIRVPAHPLAQALLHAVKFPIAAPSANKSGHVSPTLAAHVREEFGYAVMVLDGGACPVGIESTVIDLSENAPVILRPGSITQSDIEKIIGKVEIAGKDGVLKSPGMLERHYAPNKKLRLNAKNIEPDEALLAFGPLLAGATIIENLSVSGNLKEAAANLFRLLRALDASDAKSIAVMSIPEEGLGIAINDRLKRAAS